MKYKKNLNINLNDCHKIEVKINSFKNGVKKKKLNLYYDDNMISFIDENNNIVHRYKLKDYKFEYLSYNYDTNEETTTYLDYKITDFKVYDEYVIVFDAVLSNNEKIRFAVIIYDEDEFDIVFCGQNIDILEFKSDFVKIDYNVCSLDYINKDIFGKINTNFISSYIVDKNDNLYISEDLILILKRDINGNYIGDYIFAGYDCIREKYIIFDKDFNNILEIDSDIFYYLYDDIIYISNENENIFMNYKNEKILNKSTEYYLQPSFSNFKYHIVDNLNNEYGVLDSDYNLILDLKYKFICSLEFIGNIDIYKYYDCLYLVDKDGKDMIMDLKLMKEVSDFSETDMNNLREHYKLLNKIKTEFFK